MINEGGNHVGFGTIRGEITIKTLMVLKQYLLDHEYDILIRENDFGKLSDVFNEIVGRYPQNDEKGMFI